MTKKDFILIANILNGSLYKGYFNEKYGIEDIMEHFAKELEKTNEQFDRDKFLKACYK